ncbi:MAG: aldo/keto reductase [Calditrichaeota bacterium]|nr:MAG: aldo/keto reductase [Calditrichota bacterium]
MIKQILGKTGPEVTVLGYSMWFMLMKETWRIHDDIAMLKAIQTATESGINWFDTAPVYGFGHAESLLARGISHMPRESLILSTKFGIDWQNNNHFRFALRPSDIRTELENSLQRLETDYIDIYQPYIIPPNIALDEIWGELDRLKQEGKIRHIGAANFDILQARTSRTLSSLQSIQLPYSLSFRDIQEELLPYCAEHKIGVIAYSPVLLYYLLIKLGLEKSKTNHNLIRSMFTHNEDPSTSISLNKRIEPIAKKRGISISQLTIAWILCFKEISSVLVTAKNVKQLNSLIDAIDISLDRDEMAVIGEHIAETVGI